MAIEQVYLPLERFEGIDEIGFADASLFDVLAERFGVELGDAEQRVVAVAIEADEAPLLGVPEGSPGLRFHTVTRDRDGRAGSLRDLALPGRPLRDRAAPDAGVGGPPSAPSGRGARAPRGR